ncbi:hypothetical protein DUI87_09250 [Hirundo rustica rustica]|uniref:Uncharacterized protein n=1 Tax=Hirundo rustica rustica TaxID=333673 RepID=A0A3M0KTS0_HIRRU|nr:hypothetical protein DUI87_09250 [Hirundo rustica rustica]
MPASSRRDPPRAKAEPISGGGSTFGIADMSVNTLCNTSSRTDEETKYGLIAIRWGKNMLQWYLIEELLLNDNIPVLIVLCFWHNIPKTVSLSPDVCSDSLPDFCRELRGVLVLQNVVLFYGALSTNKLGRNKFSHQERQNFYVITADNEPYVNL